MSRSKSEIHRPLTWVALSLACVVVLALSSTCSRVHSVARSASPPPVTALPDEASSESHGTSLALAASADSRPQAAGEVQPSAVADPMLARGQELFANQRTICHGETGDGQGKFAYLMNPRPRNLQQGDFKLATTQNQIPTDGDLLRAIHRGMPGSAMPPPRSAACEQGIGRVVREARRGRS